jgi:predicted Zn-dependent protease with MMP-like domain
VLDVSPAEFDDVVGEALDGVPHELTSLMDNVAVFVEDEPPPDAADRARVVLRWRAA